jgi:porin
MPIMQRFKAVDIFIWAVGASFIAATGALSAEPDAAAAPAAAPKAVNLSLLYKADVQGVVAKGRVRAGRALDDLDIAADLDLEQGLHLSGLSGRVELMMTSGGAPNRAVGSLQGVNNIEVARPGTRLYQAYLEQAMAGGRFSLRAGFSDLNAEFDVTDSSSLLLAPPFGISPEIAATGRNGPSIFPSTAFAVRAKAQLGGAGYVQAGIYNADARDLGDPGGPDWSGRDGALTIAEAGWTGEGKLGVGVWRYSHRVLKLASASGAAAHAYGVYLLAERDLVKAGDAGPTLTAFFRGGVSDGETGPFSGAVQLGVRANRLLPGRPDGSLSIGYSYLALSSGYRTENLVPGTDEHKFEITYSDKISRHLTLQPDLQWSEVADGGPARHALIAGLRMTASY